MTPSVYIRRLRLSKSALRLRDEQIRIIDAAFDAGFESVDGFQRAFFREFGCNPYEYAMSPKPIYLPPQYVKPDTSVYVQGVEVPPDYSGEIPEGFDVINLPKCEYLMFQGEPFEEENFGEAIQEVLDAIKKYNPRIIGYGWDETNPVIQLEPVGTRGYVELHPVKKI